MKLNPAKCVYGVKEGMFLCFIVNQWGIDTNPDKIQALLNMKSQMTKKKCRD